MDIKHSMMYITHDVLKFSYIFSKRSVIYFAGFKIKTLI